MSGYGVNEFDPTQLDVAPEPSPAGDVAEPPQLDGFTRAANALTAAWARTHTEGNVVLSGVGCWVLLALLASTADGRARSELESAIGVPAERALEGAIGVTQRLNDMPAVHAALGLWSKAVLDPTWLEKLPAGIVGELTDDSREDEQRINVWAAEATNGEIQSLPISLNDLTRIVLASGLAVDTRWDEPFDEGAGRWADRPVSPWLTKVTGDLGAVRVAQTDLGAMTMLRLHGRHDVDVHLVRAVKAMVPGAVLATGIGALTSGNALSGLQLPDGYQGPGVRVERERSTEPHDYVVSGLPAFRIRASHDLLGQAQVLGLETASDPSRNHFPGMSAESLSIHEAVQEACAEFSSMGFRAAAVTAAVLGVIGAPPEFTPSRSYDVRRIDVRFDQPFGFVTTHRPSGLVLAAGWVDDPTSNRGSVQEAECSQPDSSVDDLFQI